MPLLRECKCGTKAYDQEDLELFTKDRKAKYGRNNICKKCWNTLNNNRRRANPDEWRNTNYKYLYGISLEEYKLQLDKQNGRCYGCGIHSDEHSFRLSVDHDHTTGKIRGLLCNECNRGIGKLKDSPEILRRLADYIEKGGVYEG